jgi:hypothetical protein
VSPTQGLITSATPWADIGLCHLMGRHAVTVALPRR